MLAFIAIGTLSLLLVYEVLRRSMAAGWLCMAATLVLTPCWLRAPPVANDLFPWIKLYSLLAACCWLMMLRTTRLRARHWACQAFWVFLAGNILEAVAKDLSGGDLAHLGNALAGLLLIPVLFVWRKTLTIDAASPYRDLRWGGMTRGWIVGYTLWNWVFVYLNYPQYAGISTAALAAPLIAGLLQPACWLQVRGFTFGFCLLLVFTFPVFFAQYADTSAWRTAAGEQFGALLSLSFMLLHAAQAFVRGGLAETAACGQTRQYTKASAGN